MRFRIKLLKIRFYFWLFENSRSISSQITGSVKYKFMIKRILERLLLGDEHYVRKFAIPNKFQQPAFRSTKKDLIIIDAQALRNSTYYRGIGRYTFSFAANLAREKSDLNVLLLFTNIEKIGNIPRVQTEIEKLGLTNLSITVIDIFEEKEIMSCREASLSLELHIEKFAPKMIFVPSQFEHPIDAIHIFPKPGNNIGVLIHDLIPLSFEKDLLPTKDQKKRYLHRVSEIPYFDKVYAVSHFTAAEVKKVVNQDLNIFVIDGSGYSLPRKKNKQIVAKLKFGVFVVGAETPHKNIPRLLEAYSRLPKELQTRHPLTIIGIRNGAAKSNLRKLASQYEIQVFMPNLLSDENVNELYLKSRLVVIPSLAEGLSMPVMESWNFGTLAIGGKGTALEEVIGHDQLLFDPYSSLEIEDKMLLYLTNDEDWQVALKKSLERLKMYNWSSVVANFSKTLFIN